MDNLKKFFLIAVTAFLVGFHNDARAFCYQEAGDYYKIAPQLLMAISKVESNFKPDAINRANTNGTFDFGVMQINSVHASKLGMKRWMALGDPCYNVYVGSWVLADCFRSYGRTDQGIGCYNVGTRKGKRFDQLRAKYAKKVRKAYNDILSATREFNGKQQEQKTGKIASSGGWKSGGM